MNAMGVATAKGVYKTVSYLRSFSLLAIAIFAATKKTTVKTHVLVYCF